MTKQKMQSGEKAVNSCASSARNTIGQQSLLFHTHPLAKALDRGRVSVYNPHCREEIGEILKGDKPV